MARSDFGGTTNDQVLIEGGDHLLRTPKEPVTLTFWSAVSGGTRYSDLVLNGNGVSTIVTDDAGNIPLFQGPDGITQMWIDAGLGPRTRLLAPGTGGGGSVSDATTSVKGVVKLASAGVTATGTATDAAVTPAGLKPLLDGKVTASEWGLIPTIFYDPTTGWPTTLPIPAGYTGVKRWDSANQGTTVPAPPLATNGDRWLRDKP